MLYKYRNPGDLSSADWSNLPTGHRPLHHHLEQGHACMDTNDRYLRKITIGQSKTDLKGHSREVSGLFYPAYPKFIHTAHMQFIFQYPHYQYRIPQGSKGTPLSLLKMVLAIYSHLQSYSTNVLT